MKLIRYSKNYKPHDKPLILTIGNFDGVHLGHQKLLAVTKEEATKLNGNSAVMTFDSHPSQTLSNARNILITPLAEKLLLLKDRAIGLIFLNKFTSEFATISPHQFIDEIICQYIKPEMIITGYDFAFGSKRAGNNELLSAQLQSHGIKHKVVSPFYINDEIICSSSYIRTLLASGNVETASKLLGYQYYIRGRVQRGDQRGRIIGFPTANIDIPEIFWPKLGVYAAKVALKNGETFSAMVNIGTRPTFGKNKIILEAHLLNFQGNLYGNKIKVELLHYMRNEQNFKNLTQLQEQIKSDKQQIEEFFSV